MSSSFNYSFELHDLKEALTPYGTIETQSPEQTTLNINEFTVGKHFRTGPEKDTEALILALEDRLLTLIVDESGSMTWNDFNGDRFTYLKRLLTKLDATYPGKMRSNLITFGGSLTKTNLFIAQADTGFLSEGKNFNKLLQGAFQDSVYDFAGVRVARRTDRFPDHPADGVIVAEGIFDAAKDEDLTEGQKYFYGVWTFNKNLHFSMGQFVSGTPFDRELPQGVNAASATPRRLPGIRRDELTQLIYNFQEKSGTIVFDSSSEGNHGVVGTEVIEDNFWLGDAATDSHEESGQLKKAVGIRFDGKFDIVEASVDDTFGIVATDAVSATQPITVNIWLFRYNQSDAGLSDIWVVGTSTADPTNNIGWMIGLTSTGNLAFQTSTLDNGLIDTGFTIPEKEWTMATIRFGKSTINEIDIFINGHKQATFALKSDLDTTSMNTLYLGAKPVSSASGWNGIDYFGSLSQFSVSNTDRSDEYINALFNTETKIFDQPSQQSFDLPPDNTQREVLLSWEIGSDFNFTGGQVKIVRKYLHTPSHINDGELVVIKAATPGQFFFIDSFDFINNSEYYYRVFTVNAIGNPCDRLEARILPVSIPLTINEPASPVLSTVMSEVVTNGNKKVLIQWANPTEDTRWVGTKLYYGDQRFPTISEASQGDLRVSDGVLIDDTTGTFFVHRNRGVDTFGMHVGLNNAEFHYYTLVTYDRLGRISDPRFLVGIPSVNSDEVFSPEEVSDLHIDLLNPITLSIQWNNPTVRSDQLDLYFGETALVFVSVKDIFGGNLDDIVNLKLQVCTTFKTRGLLTTEKELGGNITGGPSPILCGPQVLINGGCINGSEFDENCNSEEEEAETVFTFATVESGLIKGLLTHTSDRFILARRNRYDMAVRAQYKVEDTETGDTLFEFNTSSVAVRFRHPVQISLINKNNKMVGVSCTTDGEIGGIPACPGALNCGSTNEVSSCETVVFNGGYINAKLPYVCRVELQFKGEALPNGTPINVKIFKHGDDNPLNAKSDRTFIREGLYQTSAVFEEALDQEGNPTGELVSKSIADIEIIHPSLADHVDIYVSLNYLGFLVDAVHEVRFISSLFIQVGASAPFADGIDVAEQFASVWTVDPDSPDDADKKLPPADGTLVKWELLKLRFAKERPFYSTEPLSALITGVYSSTTSGVARNVFFGPVGNIKSHDISICGGTDACCLGEEYAVQSSVIVGENSAVDAKYVIFPCKEEEQFSNRRFLMNAAADQPGESPHWVTWANGESLLRFEIAKNPAIATIRGATCFRDCMESQIGGQLFPFPIDHIVQIIAHAEILWNVIFSEDPYTAQLTPVTFDIAKPIEDGDITMPAMANIPITGEVTNFYLRINKFVGDSGNPKPQECDQEGGAGGTGGSGNVLSPCDWINVCDVIGICSSGSKKKWVNVTTIDGQSTLLAENLPITLIGGGGYETGMPPLYSGFKEPLDVRIIEARVNGERISELVVDGISQITFVVEVTFSGCPVPDGTPVELKIQGPNAEIIILSNCAQQPNCAPGSTGTIFTNLVNDSLINPGNDSDLPGSCGTFTKKSLAYFTIDPLPNIGFNAKILTTCRYDKLGTVTREITRCIELNNTSNVTPGEGGTPNIPGEDPILTTVSSNETIVYDTIQDLYESTRAGQVMRMSHFAASVVKGTGDFLYNFGGFTEQDVNAKIGSTATSEVFNTADQTWRFTTDMPTPRMGGMTVVRGEAVYCIGGLELNLITDQYEVSRKIESFDTETELWNTSLAPLPENYGVAFGDAQLIGDHIYVTCGTTTVVNNTSPGILNDKILRYSVESDTWVKVTPSSQSLYQRLSPFGFFRNPMTPTIRQYQSLLVDNLDDGFFNSGTSTWDTTGEFVQIGTGERDGFMRFPISIPKGATITSAHISVRIDEGTAGETNVNIALMDVDDARNAWDATDDPTKVSDTTTLVAWNNITSETGRVSTPSISNLLQQYIQRTGYAPGKFIGIHLDNNGSIGHKNIHSFESTRDDNEAILTVKYTLDNAYYIYGGSIPKAQSEIDAEYSNELNKRLNEFRALILTSPYYLALTSTSQQLFVEEQEKKIAEAIVIPPFVYPATGFRFRGLTETEDGDDLIMDISDTLEDDWAVLPKTRDRGATVYIPHQDVVYFMGGSNQNQSTTLNRVESIDLGNDNTFTQLTPFSRGRALFGAVAAGDDIYTSGGLTSGHKEGYVEIELEVIPDFVQALGTESVGILVTFRNDSAELITDNVNCIIDGRLRIDSLDAVLTSFLAGRAADRALGGDGSGNAPDLPEAGDEIDVAKLIEAQNKIKDPNSDQFQFNAARKLNEQVFLFPILYSEREFSIVNGIGAVTLRPRSEDPLADFEKLAEFIKKRTDNIPIDSNEKFEGNLTREELVALGDTLETIKLPPTIINAGTFRELYQIETIVTIVDRFHFGQTVSDFDFQIQDSINSRIKELLTPPDPCEGISCPEGQSCDPLTGDCIDGDPPETRSRDSGVGEIESLCFLLQHLGDPEISVPSTPPPDNPNSDGPAGTGGFAQSGQCLFCISLIPLKPDTRPQLPTQLVTYWNATDWVPQVRGRLVEGTHTLKEVLTVLDIIDHEVPFGGSQLYNAMIEAGRATTGDRFSSVKKVAYIASDNSQNLSLTSRDKAIEEINSVDGDKSTPVIYTVFSTSFPVSIASQFERTEVGDVEKITQGTGGQSSTLVSSTFLDQILNLTLGGATGGLGYGIYTRKIDFGEITAVTRMTLNFTLPTNTQGFVRFKHSLDGYNFGDFSERFEGSRTVDFIDFFAQVIELEVVLTTGFTTDVAEEYDLIATGIPKFNSILWKISNEREDFVFLNAEQVLTNAQQVAVAFEGDVPPNSIIEVGVASSFSHDWRDFKSQARPAFQEFGKTFLLDRAENPASVVIAEPLETRDGILFTSNYGPWDPSSTIVITKTKEDGTDEFVLTGFVSFPREGEIYFHKRQSSLDAFIISITNNDILRVGLRLRNRLHTESILVRGIGYIYSTNDNKPVELTQVAPRALNVFVSPAAPTAADTILALYDFRDINNDPEVGSIVNWYKNGLQLFEIQNKLAWVNGDLNNNNKLVPNDKISFAVSPSDGKSFGPTVFSPTVTIIAQPPGVENVVIIPVRNGATNNRFDTGSTFVANYIFTTDDIGTTAIEEGTIIRWFVNGIVFKEGIFSSSDEDPYINPKELTPLDTFEGGIAHVIGSQIFVEVTPKTVLITGDTVKSSTISVVNSIGILSSVAIAPANPTVQSTLNLTYTLDDPDVDSGDQTDQAEIKWFNSTNGIDFLEVEDVRGQKDIGPSDLQAGQVWYTQVTPFDGLDLGSPVKSNQVTIQPG